MSTHRMNWKNDPLDNLYNPMRPPRPPTTLTQQCDFLLSHSVNVVTCCPVLEAYFPGAHKEHVVTPLSFRGLNWPRRHVRHGTPVSFAN
jgi:hypothetical protein